MKRLIIFCSLYLLLIGATPAMAQDQHTKAVKHITGPAKVKIIRKIEDYFADLKNLKSGFTQISHNGTKQTGRFYLSRPGKLRFEYDHLDDFIVADGTFIFFYDAEMQQQSNTTIGNSLADFILREDIQLSGDIRVKDIYKTPQYILITLYQTNNPEAGHITLAFQPSPFRLKKWRVVDAQGGITEVTLHNIKRHVVFNDDLFKFIDPRHGKSGFND